MKLNDMKVQRITVDGFIVVGTSFRGFNKNHTFRVVIIFSFIIHSENCYFVGIEICGSGPP